MRSEKGSARQYKVQATLYCCWQVLIARKRRAFTKVFLVCAWVLWTYCWKTWLRICYIELSMLWFNRLTQTKQSFFLEQEWDAAVKDRISIGCRYGVKHLEWRENTKNCEYTKCGSVFFMFWLSGEILTLSWNSLAQSLPCQPLLTPRDICPTSTSSSFTLSCVSCP